MAIGAAIGSIGGALIGASSSNKAAKAQEKAAKSSNDTQRYIYDRNVELSEPQRIAGQNALAALSYELGLGERPTAGGFTVDDIVENAPQFTRGYSPEGGSKGGGGFASVNSRPLFSRRDGAANHLASHSSPTFSVGGQTFDSRQEAEDFVSGQTGNFNYRGFEASPGYQFQLEEGNKALERAAAARGLNLSGATLRESGRFNQGLANQEYGTHLNRLASLAGAGQTAVGQQMSAGSNYASAVGQNNYAAGQARASGYQGVNNAIQGGLNNAFQIYGMHQGGFFGGGGGVGPMQGVY